MGNPKWKFSEGSNFGPVVRSLHGPQHRCFGFPHCRNGRSCNERNLVNLCGKTHAAKVDHGPAGLFGSLVRQGDGFAFLHT